MFLIAVASALACETLQEGSGLSDGGTTGPDDTTTSSASGSTTSSMMETVSTTTPATTTPTSTSASSSDTTTSDTGDTTESVITTDETTPMTTDETGGTTEPATSSSSSSSSSTGMSECNYLAAGACGNCIDTMCCVELMECEAGSMQCQQHLDCLVDGTAPSECASDFDHPSTHDLRDCIEASCMPPCT